MIITERRTVSRTSELVPFGFCDKGGRSLGVIVWRGVEEFTDKPEGSTYGYHLPAGTYFSATVHSTRNSKPFGASQPEKFFPTESERDAWVARRVADTRKRYEKQRAVGFPPSFPSR